MVNIKILIPSLVINLARNESYKTGFFAFRKKISLDIITFFNTPKQEILKEIRRERLNAWKT